MPDLIDVTDATGRIARPDWLARAEPTHRELRNFAEPYETVMTRVFAGGGRMRVAVDGDAVLGVAVWRVYENTYPGLHMYVDDLVTTSTRRSTGVGRALLSSLERTSRELGCKGLALDSGTARRRAHGFYLREKLEITAFHFFRKLSDDVPKLIV
jgi:GNAT superfamily N-acetyltransferase